MANKRRKKPHAPKRNTSLTTPALSFSYASRAFFIYGGQIYPIDGSSPSIFIAAFQESMPRGWEKEVKMGQLLGYGEMDLLIRWALLCYAADQGYPLKLYTREEAERALSN